MVAKPTTGQAFFVLTALAAAGLVLAVAGCPATPPPRPRLPRRRRA
jgi:hypothetical protein